MGLSIDNASIVTEVRLTLTNTAGSREEKIFRIERHVEAPTSFVRCFLDSRMARIFEVTNFPAATCNGAPILDLENNPATLSQVDLMNVECVALPGADPVGLVDLEILDMAGRWHYWEMAFSDTLPAFHKLPPPLVTTSILKATFSHQAVLGLDILLVGRKIAANTAEMS